MLENMLENMLESKRGMLAVAGGMSIHLMIGSFYLWGTISTYVVAYYRLHDSPTLTIATANILFPVSSVMNCLFNNLGLYLSSKFGSRKATFVCSVLNALVVFLSSFTKSFWGFFSLYGVC